jgi:glycosyltransferase involved in cell wall biosynthesis
MDKLVSIILPTYNGRERIEEAIRSVVGQTYPEWELLVVDDGSADGTDQIIAHLASLDARIRYIKNEYNLGIQKTLNRGLKEAKGEYIARIDDDDLWSDRNKLSTQVQFFTEHPDHVLVGTGTIIVNEKGTEISRYLLPKDDQSIRNKLLIKNCFTHSSVIYRRDVVLASGGYSESLDVQHIEDHELWLRLGLLGKMANLPSYSVTFCARANSLTSENRIPQARKTLILLKAYKDKYPHFFLGYIVNCVRLLFFLLRKVIPLPASIVYKIQARYRNL